MKRGYALLENIYSNNTLSQNPRKSVASKIELPPGKLDFRLAHVLLFHESLVEGEGFVQDLRGMTVFSISHVFEQ
jgi:hypothetical protein